MWKATAGITLKTEKTEDDDWETDPDFINDVTEQEQRWGSKTVEGSGRNAGAIDMEKLRKETEEADAKHKKKLLSEGPNSAFGYGGKFGIEKDRMDNSAVGHDYLAELEKHASQKDYSTGFGGKYGLQVDRVDKSAVSWDHKEKLDKHPSQRDYTSGFGGKFGVQSDRQDRSAVGWDHIEKLDKHESQKDYAKGFGGKFGVQVDRVDKCAVGWDHHEAPQKHESQTDHKIGFGGKFGVQSDRMDKSAASFNEEPEKVSSVHIKAKPAALAGVNPSALRAKFENMGSEEKEVYKNGTTKPTSRQLIQAKTAIFNSPQNRSSISSSQHTPKQLDQTKTEFLNRQNAQTDLNFDQSEHVGKLDHSKIAAFADKQRNETPSSPVKFPRQLDQSKTAIFNKTISSGSNTISSNNQIKHELQELAQHQQQKRLDEISQDEETETNKIIEKIIPNQEDSEVIYVEEDEAEGILEDTGLTAIALYDYQAAADDEISFDPEDIITHVEMIDEGWWRGLCRNQYGLFPANYVQLQH